MRKQAPTIEWQIVESDEAWERLCALPGLNMSPSVAPTPGPPPIQRLIVGVMLLLLLAGAAGWWRQSLHTGMKTTIAPSPGAVTEYRDIPASRRSAANLWCQDAQKDNGILAEPITIPRRSGPAVAVGMECP